MLQRLAVHLLRGAIIIPHHEQCWGRYTSKIGSSQVYTPLAHNDSINKVGAFSYELGSGYVYYSTSPLDYYLNGSGPAG